VLEARVLVLLDCTNDFLSTNDHTDTRARGGWFRSLHGAFDVGDALTDTHAGTNTNAESQT